MGALVLLTLALLASSAHAAPSPRSREGRALEEAAARVAAAIEAGDAATLAALAAMDETDPWVVADTLLAAGKRAAAAAFAGGAPRPDTEALPAYVSAAEEAPGNASARETLDQALAALESGDPRTALAVLEDAPPPEARALRVRVGATRARALAALGRAADADRVALETATLAEEVGWLSLAASMYAGISDPRLRVRVLERALAVALRRGDVASRAATSIDLGRERLQANDLAGDLELCRVGIPLARGVGRGDWVVHGLTCQGMAQHRTGDDADAHRSLLQAVEVAASLGDEPLLAKSLANLGALQCDALREYERARETFERGLRIVRRIGDRGTELALRRSLGIVCNHLQEWDKARSHLERARALARETGSLATIPSLWRLQQGVEIHAGHPAAALRALDAELEAAREAGSPVTERVAHALRGNLLVQAGRQAEALRALEAAWALLDPSVPTRELVDISGTIGETLRHLGDYRGAIPWLERSLGAAEALGDEHAAAIARLNLGAAWQQAGEYPAAREAYARAHEVFVRLGDRRLALQVLENQAVLEEDIGTYARALEAYEGVRIAYETGGLHRQAALVRERIARLHRKRGDVAAALAAFRGAAETYERLGVRRERSVVGNTIADLLAATGDAAAAVAEYERAHAGLQGLGDDAEESLAAGRLARLLAEGGRREEAVAWARRAAEAADRVTDLIVAVVRWMDAAEALEAAGAQEEVAALRRRAEARLSGADDAGAARARLYHVEAKRAYRQGRWSESLALEERARAAAQRAGDRGGVALADWGAGLTYSSLDLPEKAREAYRSALEAYQAMGERYHVAAMLVNLGSVERSLGRWDEALEYFRRGLAEAEAVGHADTVANAVANIGSIHDQRGDPAEALVWKRRSLELSEQVHDLTGASVSLGMMARTYLLLGDAANARACAQRSLAVARESRVRPVLAAALEGAVVVASELGDHSDALALAHEAWDLGASFASGLEDEQGARARGEATVPYRMALRSAVACSDVPEAHFFVEATRAAALLEALQGRRGAREAAIAAPLREAERASRAAEASATRDLRAVLSSGDRRAIRERSAAVDAARREVQAAVERIQREERRAAGAFAPRPAPLGQVQGALLSGEVLVLYAEAGPDLVALVVSALEARLVPLGPTAEARKAAEDLVLHDPTVDPGPQILTLRRLLVRPLALPAETKRVLVSPDGPLYRVPFALLLHPMDVACVPSATAWLELREEGRSAGRGVLAVGDPDYGVSTAAREIAVEGAAAVTRGGAPRFPRLPATADEARAVGDVVLLQGEATEEGLARALPTRPRWRAVHFACHGTLDEARPSLSSLVLTAAGDDDGFLTSLDVYRLRPRADLVAMSACETARGEVVRGEGLLGLSRAFLVAGADRVLCSLWKVDDEATRALMVRFYELWNPKDGSPAVPAAQALRQAQEHVRSEPKWAHPHYWAAWVLWGLAS